MSDRLFTVGEDKHVIRDFSFFGIKKFYILMFSISSFPSQLLNNIYRILCGNKHFIHAAAAVTNEQNICS